DVFSHAPRQAAALPTTRRLHSRRGRSHALSVCLVSFFFFSSRRRHTIWPRDWSSDVCSSDLDWRVADRIKRDLLERIDYLLDTTDPATPKMSTGEAFRAGLQCARNRPFRVVPFFDPGPWGGQWMREVCDLPDGPPNYAWCFDCVPEENSLLLNMAGVN